MTSSYITGCLQTLDKWAKVKYGDRLSVQGTCFTIDGIRIFVKCAQKGDKVGLLPGSIGEWVWNDSPTFYDDLLDRLSQMLEHEKTVRRVFETQN